MDAALLAAWAGVATALATATLAVFGVGQIRALRQQSEAQGIREKKWATANICNLYNTSERINAAEERIFLCFNSEGDLKARLLAERRAVRTLLNYLDMIAIGVYQGIYVKEMVDDHLGSLIRSSVKDFIEVHGVVKREQFPCLVKLKEELMSGQPVVRFQDKPKEVDHARR